LAKLEEKYPQYHINGTDNIWILKPAGLSRGRGIICLNTLAEIMDHLKSKEMQWVAQKYIENPLIVKKRKFDIRVWVLVSDWNPLTIWIYDECYIRFSAQDYNTNNLTDK
jgi:tubulin monoglycylase TTLL3/8